MKGIVFDLLRDLVRRDHGEDAWQDLLERAGFDAGRATPASCSESELGALVEAAWQLPAPRSVEQIEPTRADRQQELLLLEAVAGASNNASTIEEALENVVPALCRYAGWSLAHAWVSPAPGVAPCDSGIWHVEIEGQDDTPPEPEPALLEHVLACREPVWVDGDVPYSERGVASAFAFPILVEDDVRVVVELLAPFGCRPDPGLERVALLVAARLTRVAERAAAREQIVHQTLHDPLTGLPNRVLFEDRLTLALERGRRRSTLTGVLFLDVDRFKLVNDTLGHRAGDQLLAEVATRLRGALRASDTVARFGGDEFAILCEELADDRDALRVADAVHAALDAPCVREGESRALSTSIGVALARGRGATAESLMRHADAAMYRAKELGRARTEVFDECLRARLEEQLSMERDLRHGLAAGELRLAYQPVISLATGEVRSVEALLRWDHPERGVLMPGDFLPAAEESGLIVHVGDHVLTEAFRQAAIWRLRFGDDAPLPIHVNLAARQLGQATLVDTVLRLLEQTGARASDIALEITESAVIENRLLASDMLRNLKAIGFEILLDDFGIGYSSLGYLQQLPIDVLKIDSSFIDGLGDGEQRASAIVKAIVGMADALAIDVVAEGVETDEQAERSHALGCDLAQGYLFAHPVGPEEVEALAGRRFMAPAG